MALQDLLHTASTPAAFVSRNGTTPWVGHSKQEHGNVGPTGRSPRHGQKETAVNRHGPLRDTKGQAASGSGPYGDRPSNTVNSLNTGRDSERCLLQKLEILGFEIEQKRENRGVHNS